MFRKNWCFLVLLFLGFHFGNAQNTASLKGTIYDQDSIPLAFASLQINNQVSWSGEDGTFYIKDIAEGLVHLQVSEMGYDTYTDSFVIHSGETRELEIYLNSSVNNLEEVILIGKTSTEILKEQPIRTQVVETQSHSAQPISLSDLMNQSSGIRIRQNGGLGSRPEISLNGFQGRSIKYFKDGIPLDYLGNGYNISSLPLEALDHVEVYKGVLPVNLGADALGGAVNLVTKQNKGKNLHAFYEIGSFHTHRLGVIGATESKNQKYFAGMEVFGNYSDNDYRANVEVVDPDTRNKEIRRLPMFHNGFQNFYTEVFVGTKNKTWADELRFSVAAFGLKQEQQNPSLMTDAYGAVESKQSSLIPSLRYKKAFFKRKLQVDQFVAYNDLQTQRIDTLHGSYDWYGNFTPKSSRGETRLPSQSHVHEKQWNARTNLLYRLNSDNRITFNYVFTRAKRYGKDPYGPKLADTNIDVLTLPSTYQKHVFGASWDSYALDRDLHNQLMGKFYVYQASGILNTWYSTDITLLDKKSQSGEYWGVADAIKYQLSPNSLVRTSAEFTYRLPERDELFGNNIFIVPNFNLNPERSFNLNLGYQFKPGKDFNLEANGFYRRTKDMILLVPIQAPNAQYQNQENIKGYGFDVDVSYGFFENYKINANASWQNLRLFGIQTTGDKWKNNARLRNTPYFLANAGIQAKYINLFSQNDEFSPYLQYNFVREFYLETIPKSSEPGGILGLSGSANLSSKLVIPNQHLLNIGFTYRFLAEQMSIGAEVRNLLNTELFDYYRIPRPGRSFSVKISYKL